MEEDTDFRRWDEMIPEALALIFKKLSLRDKLMGIPTVCKRWSEVVTGPCCWQEIEISNQDCNSIEILNRLLEMLLTRSSSTPREVSIEGELANDQSLSLIADHAQSLRTLKLRGSIVTGSALECVATRLSFLTHLDVSHCEYIGAVALKVIGTNCKYLIKLERNIFIMMVGNIALDEEAFVIASTMPKLKQLSICNSNISTDGVFKIISSCPDLEFLDIRGCSDVELDRHFIKKKSHLTVLGPQIEHRVDYPDYQAFYPYGPDFSSIDDIYPIDIDFNDLDIYEGIFEE